MNHTSSRSNTFLQGCFTLVIFFSLVRIAVAQVCVEPPSGLVSWWRGEGNATDTINDNPGTLMNGATFASGQVGLAFSFDGVDDVVSIPDAPNLNFASTSSFTIELWAFRTSGALMHLVGKREGCGPFPHPPFYQMAIGSGAFPSEDFLLNVWTHAAVTYDGSTGLQQQYLNGVVVASGDASAFIGPNTAPFLIGTSGACPPFAGLIDEVSLYSRALSAEEIQGIFAAGSAGKCVPAFQQGDVFVSGQGDVVDWRRADGTLVRVLHTGVSAPAGLALDATHKLYVTTFFGHVVSVFDTNGTLTGTFGSGYSSNIESIVFDAVGNAYVGGADGNLIYKFDAAGTPLNTFTVPTESRGTDWIDLAADQRTIFYTSEGRRILRFDTVTNTPLPDFNASPLPGSSAYALRILPDGGVLVADTQFVLRLDAGGNVVQTYTLPGTSLLLAANLDPDGKSFWTGDLISGQVFKVDLATGTVLLQFTTSTNSALGLAIVGEITFCGNGKIEGDEQCDDGNTTSGDGCSATCQTEFCGDGTVQPGLGEECDDGKNGDNGDGCTDSCQINFDPDCAKAAASPAVLWPPSHQGVDISIVGVTDPDGDPLTITPTSVFQDEPVAKMTGDGAGATSPDASLSPLQVRAERNGNPKTPGDGRVYHLGFMAEDGLGGSCTGQVLVCVPHDQGRRPTCIDEGPLYNSLLP